MEKDYTLAELTEEQAAEIDDRLDADCRRHIGYRMEGKLELGAWIDGGLVAGILGYASWLHILYVETVWVDKEYRRQGLGAALLAELERRATDMGFNLIRLDTLDWQGREFYKACGYEEVGSYTEPRDGFSEYFFIKRL